MRIVALLLLLCLLAGKAWGATSYVTQGGAGSANGTSLANACNGVADADCTKNNGDTVYICGAWTSAVSLATATTVTYDLNCNGESPATFNVAGIAWTIGGASKYTVKGGTLSTSSNVCMYIVGADDVTVREVTFTGCTGTAINFDNTADADNVSLLNNIFVDNKAACITIIDTATAGIDWANMLISGNSFTNCNSLGTASRGAMRFTIANANTTATFTNWQIINNTFTDNGNGQDVVDLDIGVQPTIAALRNQVVNLLVSGNTSTDSGPLMTLKGLYGGRIEDNTITRFTGACGMACIFWSTGTVIQRNTATSGVPITIDGGGIDIDTGNIGITVRSNFLKGNVGIPATQNTGYGIMILDAQANYVYGNIAIGNKYGLYLGDEGGLTNPNFVYNNTFCSSVNDGIFMYSALTTNNNTIKNNIICNNTLYGVNGTTATDQTMDYNDLYGNGSGTYTGQAAGGADVASNPSFVGGTTPTTLQGFRLLPTSPLKCAGTSVGRLTDALGRGFEPDCTPIGAMVYGRGDLRATPLSPRP